MAYQPINTITSALRSIGALEAGEQPTSEMATDAFNLLNEMLDQWSNDHLMIFTQQEVIQELTGGQYIYTIGPGGSVGATFYGTLNGTVLTITQILSGAVSAGQMIQGSGVINDTAITSLGTGLAGANGTGTYNVNISNNIFGAVVTGSIAGSGNTGVLTVTAVTSGAIVIGTVVSQSTAGTVPNLVYVSSLGTGTGGTGTYNLTSVNTVPTLGSGTVTITPAFTSYAPRPLRINSAFVRVVNSITGTLDYPCEVMAYEKYQLIGIKTLNGPWPRAVYYQPTEPVGVLNYWPNPAQGEMHLFCDTVLNHFVSLYDSVTLPKGYHGCMHWGLSELLMPEYGKKDPTIVAMVTKQADRARKMIKRTNAQPQMEARFDDAMQNRTRVDAGFILSGGFS